MAREAWILETSNRQWAARRIDSVGNVSNGLAIGAEWEHGSSDLVSHAAERGWWSAGGERLDFARAYADPAVPEMVACPRRARAAERLAAATGRIDVGTMRAILRDHHDLGAVHRPRPDGDPNFFTLCMHADPLDNTTASMIAALAEDPEEIHPIWVSLGSPCLGAFVPVYQDAEVPPLLARVSAAEDPVSPWWTMRRLLTLVEASPEERAPLVQARWGAFEDAVAIRAADAQATARDLRARRDHDEARAVLGRAAAAAVEAYVRMAIELVRELGG